MEEHTQHASGKQPHPNHIPQHGMDALLERHRMPTCRHMARKPLIPLLDLLPLFHFLSLPKQPHPEPGPADDMQTRRRCIRIHITDPHARFPFRDITSIPLPPSPHADHLLGLPLTLPPHNGVTPLIESATADFSVIPPRATFGGDDVGAEVLDDAVMLHGFHPVGAAGGDLMDQGWRGVGHVEAPGGDDEEGIAVFGKGAEAFTVRPDRIEDARLLL